MAIDDRQTGGATARGLAAWHSIISDRDPAGLADLLAQDAVFRSPIVFKPQEGKALTSLYLTAAIAVLGTESFTYVRELVDGENAVLEFEVTIDGIDVNGVDMIRFGPDGQIVDFKVMLRPMKGIAVVGERMAAMLAELSSAAE